MTDDSFVPLPGSERGPLPGVEAAGPVDGAARIEGTLITRRRAALPAELVLGPATLTQEQFAQQHGLFRPYHDTVFRRFWSHDLEIDELSDIAGVITSVGGSAGAFEAYIRGPARAEHDRIIDEAEALGVFGVPTMVFNGELFWGGDRIDLFEKN